MLMKQLRSFMLPAVLLGVVLALGGFAQDKDKTVKVGDKVPAFTLSDTAGKSYNLADLKGTTVVLEWFNPDCPYVQKAYDTGVIKRTRQAIKEMDGKYIHLVVNSSAHLGRDEISKGSSGFMKERKLDLAVLLDSDGKVGTLLGARTTPHMFIIDAEGVLRYSGALTDDPLFSKGDEATNYVLGALKQITADETVSPDTTRPWGCAVKYADDD